MADDQEGLPQARACEPPRLQPRRHGQAREVQGRRRGLRRHRRRREAEEVRRGTRPLRLGRFPRWLVRQGGGVGFDLNDLLRDRRGLAAGSATSSATSSGAAAAARATRRGRCAGADVETSATIGFTDALDGVTICLRLTSDSACPDCHGTGGKPGTQPKICPECEGAGFIVTSPRRGLLDQRDLPALRRPPARLRRGVPDLPRLGSRHLVAHDPGAHPGRRQGRPADPVAGKGGAGESGGAARRPLRDVKVTPPPALRAQGRQPHPRRARVVRRGRPRAPRSRSRP